MKQLNAILGIALIAWLGIGHAEEYEVVNLGSRLPTSKELVNALTPSPAPKVRGTVMHGSTSRWQGVSEAVPQPKPKAVSMQIQFNYNSTELTADARTKLDIVAAALNSGGLASYRFIVEGHTDSIGSEAYNMRLSQSRAQSVVNYMHEYHGIDPGRLAIVGKGMKEPANPSNPASPANRRVVIVNAGSL